MGIYNAVGAAYETAFWKTMKTPVVDRATMESGRSADTNAYYLPLNRQDEMENALANEDAFRRIATFIRAYDHDNRILACDTEDTAGFIKEAEVIPAIDGQPEFSKVPIDVHKLAALVSFDEDFVNDSAFDFQKFLLRRFARVMGKGEEKAFINGTGSDEPTGILHEEKGAPANVETSAFAFDDIIKLYFSIEAEYRDHGTWLMNDKTALTLRSMKDSSGNYLWRGSDDLLFGKPVVVSNFMPDAESGKSPVVFADFSYYWIICRKPVSVRALRELYALQNKVGFVGTEYLDGKLIRRKAAGRILVK
ncbi:MAG: phage major capsid protein [Clostridia bacterium]|jgi:HK97 family phage major capsid protein|nr:phage major capsid protein [Clostridia bacterium]MCI2014540.1 phage major capsid protein [Clostridia bacterium]